MTKKSNKKQLTWKNMEPGQKAAVFVTGTVQMILAATAWRDLAKRSASQINGPKGLWAVIIAVNWVGPIAYFVGGRRKGS
ncbi:MAG: PLD nuclease N-terminal domain-containing protein [Mycetocola sp.]